MWFRLWFSIIGSIIQIMKWGGHGNQSLKGKSCSNMEIISKPTPDNVLCLQNLSPRGWQLHFVWLNHIRNMKHCTDLINILRVLYHLGHFQGALAIVCL